MLSYYSRKIQLVKKKVRTIKYPLVYEPKKWRFIHAGGYAYALDLDINDPKERILFPGYISNSILSHHRKSVFNENELLRRIKQDLKFLDIYYRQNDSVIWDDEYRIAIYYKYSYSINLFEYRILRQDEDLSWSEKLSWKGNVRQIKERGCEPPDLFDEGFNLLEVMILHE